MMENSDAIEVNYRKKVERKRQRVSRKAFVKTYTLIQGVHDVLHAWVETCSGKIGSRYFVNFIQNLLEKSVLRSATIHLEYELSI